ncbi:MAG: type I methionyl aminopeptidase [bacterium]|nr:type I methionyl aminopeptidase [bacterium]
MSTIKTKEDIKKLREGGKRLARILHEVASFVKPGVSTDFLNSKAHELIMAGGDTSAFLNYTPHGAERPFPASLCVSVNDEIVHGIPNEKPQVFKEGDIVSLDLGLIHEGLITDHAITVGVGKISKEAQKLLDVTKKALDIGIKAAKGNKKTGDIGYAIQKYVEPFNVGIIEELAGHGVGYSVHEDPFVPNYGIAGEGALLKPGMVIAIEPMFTLGGIDIKLARDGYTFKTKDGSLAAHFEHTIVITEKGAEILTQ